MLDIFIQIFCHTHLKRSNPYTYFFLMKKPPDGFFTHNLCLRNGGLFIHRRSSLLKFKIKCLRVPTTDYSRQKCITRRENPSSIKPIWKSINRPPKGHTKNIPFFLCAISKDWICHILSSKVS